YLPYWRHSPFPKTRVRKSAAAWACICNKKGCFIQLYFGINLPHIKKTTLINGVLPTLLTLRGILIFNQPFAITICKILQMRLSITKRLVNTVHTISSFFSTRLYWRKKYIKILTLKSQDFSD